MKHKICALLLAIGLLHALPAYAQDEAEGSDEIVVAGLRDLDDPGSVVTTRTLSSKRTGAGARKSRNVFYYSQRFAKCATKPSDFNLRYLRRVLDGRTNSMAQAQAQQRLVHAHATCAEDPTAVRQFNANAANSTEYDTAYYDRGALFIEAINAFAPDLKLTTAETEDKAVQARFNARENSLMRFRLPLDRRYFETAVCLVRLQPKLAVRLVKTDSPDMLVNSIEAEMVNRARVCVGGAKKVYFDPAQFRFYIADAVYRWAVAARGVDSLIPAE